MASIWRKRSRAAALAACLLVAGLAPGFSLAQDGDLAARVKSLEAEIANLKIVVGTLESLVRATPPSALAQEDAAPDATDQDALDPRVSALETQIGALIDQIEQLSTQLTRLEAKRAAPPQASASAPPAATPEAKTLPPQMSALTEEEVPAPEAATPGAATENADPRARWYGPKPGEEDDGNPKSISPPGATGALPDDGPQSFAALPDENAEALYKQGYGDYLRRDYAGAEKAFSQLVKAYPNDPLAGSAQYWIGETYYVRKQYRKAADTFLVGYRKYASGDKAPDSLLKLAMSLAALGDKAAACNTFKKLDDTFPDATGEIRSQAKSERKKVGC